MTETIQNPLSAEQNVRAAALSLAATITEGRSVKTDDVLDLAEFIVGPQPCPLAGLEDPIYFDVDLADINRIFTLPEPTPAEPEVYTVRGAEGLAALPIGSVIRNDGSSWAYTRRPQGWVNVKGVYGDKDAYQDSAFAHYQRLVVDYIPGGF